MIEQKTSNTAFIHANSAGRTGGLPVRRSLCLAAASLAFCLVALPASAANWWSTTPSVSIGSKIINVRNAGAMGNGQHDDTSAFQAAINSLPSTGGTITVPAGTYMINAVRSINMRSHVRLQLSSGAKLVAIPNSSQRYNVIKVARVNNVEITGGAIVGERARHIGSTGEWGMGIDILASSKVYVHDMKISDCWGDGLYIGAIGPAGSATPSTDVTVKNVVSTNNRRQGLSFGPVNRVYVYGSTFSNTHGTNPEAGIDIEPSVQGTSYNVRIERSTVTGNAGSGLELQAHVTGLVLASNTVKGNKGFGVYSNGAYNVQIAGNTITENGLDGISVRSTSHDMRISSNKVTYNSTRWFIANRKSIYTLTSSARDLDISSSARSISLVSNTLSPKP